MSTPIQARVIIAGGSVAGLTLANALEQLGISYILLEKYAKIAPDLGASIATMANAGRILDQLGCYDQIKALVEDGRSNRHLTTVGLDGKKFGDTLEINKTFHERFGYGFIFLPRKRLLEILYNNIRDKSPILTDKAVVSIEHIEGGVRATCKDGSSYTGELLVGADGVHSQVRKEMWRLADLEHPKYLPSEDRQGIPIPYRCIFGISSPVPEGFDTNYNAQVLGNQYSFLVSGAPPDGDSTERMFWFLFAKNREPAGTLHKDIPRYTDQDAEALADQFRDSPVWGNVRFGQVWDNRTAATLTALPEFVYSKWHYGRIITIGDAAHKFNPIGGQGGNNAIEDCAVLVNQLTDLFERDPSKKSDPLTTEEIQSAFARFQDLRTDRARQFMQRSHDMQSLMAQEGIRNKLFGIFMKYISSGEGLIKQLSQPWLAAPRINALPVPERSRTIPFDDERTTSKSLVGPKMGALMVFSSVVVGIAALAQNEFVRTFFQMS